MTIVRDLLRSNKHFKQRSNLEALAALRAGMRSPLYRFRLTLGSKVLGRRAWRDMRDILLPDPPERQIVQPVKTQREEAVEAVVKAADEYVGSPIYCRGYPNCDEVRTCKHCALTAEVVKLRSLDRPDDT